MEDLTRLWRRLEETKVKVSIPKMVVLGDTSSGKSSLLSLLSGIELPSSHQFTTKCPLELILLPSADGTKWAQVSVEWKGPPPPPPTTPEEEESPANGGAWKERIPAEEWETRLSATIQKAQDSILSVADGMVSRDTIRVTVQDTEHPHPLQLVDLPGWIRSTTTDESPRLASDIQSLLEPYMQHPNSILLVVIPSNVDVHNSPLELLPSDRFVVPILTKPDLIDTGAEQSVVDLLQGKIVLKNVSHPFHMCKGRGQAAMESQSLAQAREAETEYFQTQAPWCNMDNKLFGVTNLRDTLASLQAEMIRQSLPQVAQEVRRSRDETHQALQQETPPLESMADKRRYYQDISQALLNQLQSILSGRGGNNELIQSGAAALHRECQRFKDEIQKGSLATIRKISDGTTVLVASSSGGSVRGEVVHFDETFACVDFIDPTDRNYNTLFDAVRIKSQTTLEVDDVWSDGDKVYIARDDNEFDVLRKIPLAHIRTDPAWLRDRIVDHRTEDLTCFLNVDIFKNIIREFINKEWQPHCRKLIDETQQIVQCAIADACKNNMPRQYPELANHMQRLCHSAANELLQGAREQVEAHLRVEQHPYTQDNVLFDNIRAAKANRLRQQLGVVLKLDQEGTVYDTQAIRALVDSVLETPQTSDEYLAEELELALESYGEIATKRVVDRIPMLCWDVFRTLVERVQRSLWSVTDDTLQTCTPETQENGNQYRELKQAAAEFDEALEVLATLSFY